MPQDFLISVIVPVYNVEKYLSQCLENLIYQTYKNLEIIIVDDGSTDGSHLVYEKYAAKDPRIKIVKQANKGPSGARNAGMKQAHGEYIYFMDSDDYIDLDYYEKMIKAAIDTQADIACSRLCFFRSNGVTWAGINFSQNAILTNVYDKLHVSECLRYPGVTKFLFKSEFVKNKNLSFEEGRCCGEDSMFSVPALYYSNKVVLVPEAMYHYRRDSYNSITNMIDSEKVKKRNNDDLYMRNKLKEFAISHNFEIRVDNPDKDYVMSKYKLFSKLSLFRKKVYNDKIKYYIFGGKICVLTVNTSEGNDK
ncbi:MAG: glycosyltransferase [Elusimicrobiota bacterium]|nr:glycosyltransferase [Elusimicrobiota bacterium]